MSENLKAVIGRLLDRIEDLESELSHYREQNERDKADIRQDVHAQAGESANSEDNPQGKSEGNRLPIEELAQIEDSEDYHTNITPSVERAVAIYQHFSEWSQKAPAGRTIRDSLKALLQTATGERLAWRQVYRAMEKLEEWSKGAIRMERTTRHGRVLIEDRSSSVARGG